VKYGRKRPRSGLSGREKALSRDKGRLVAANERPSFGSKRRLHVSKFRHMPPSLRAFARRFCKQKCTVDVSTVTHILHYRQ